MNEPSREAVQMKPKSNSRSVPERMAATLIVVAFGAFAGCALDSDAAQSDASTPKGGDDRTGQYIGEPAWLAEHPEAPDWEYAQVSGVVADSPDRIIVGIRGDRDSQGQERPNSSNYIVVVNGSGEVIERWTQWDSLLGFPHQLYISPYDPERHVWVVDRGGTSKVIHEQILKFTNDGSELVLRLRDPNPTANQGGPNPRENPNPGPLDFGQASVMAFLPNGDFLVGDGYQNGRIIRFNAQGEFISEFGSVGSGPGQFDLIHGLDVDQDRRIYVADRNNNRIQVFTESGEFIAEWPDVTDPVGVVVDEDQAVWVISAALNRILKYNREGELQYHFGTYGGTRGGFPGGLARPHQLSVDQEGKLYIASYDGPWLNPFTPRPNADPSKLVGRPLVLER